MSFYRQRAYMDKRIFNMSSVDRGNYEETSLTNRRPCKSLSIKNIEGSFKSPSIAKGPSIQFICP